MPWENLESEIEDLFSQEADKEESEISASIIKKSLYKKHREVCYANIKNDPARWKAMLDRQNKWRREKYKRDKTYREKENERMKVWRKNRKKSPI